MIVITKQDIETLAEYTDTEKESHESRLVSLRQRAQDLQEKLERTYADLANEEQWLHQWCEDVREEECPGMKGALVGPGLPTETLVIYGLSSVSPFPEK